MTDTVEQLAEKRFPDMKDADGFKVNNAPARHGYVAGYKEAMADFFRVDNTSESRVTTPHTRIGDDTLLRELHSEQQREIRDNDYAGDATRGEISGSPPPAQPSADQRTRTEGNQSLSPATQQPVGCRASFKIWAKKEIISKSEHQPFAMEPNGAYWNKTTQIAWEAWREAWRAAWAAARQWQPDETVEQIARRFHDAYEAAAVDYGWKTQGQCRVSFDDLPEANRLTMLDATRAALAGVPEREAQQPVELPSLTSERRQELVQLAINAVAEEAGKRGRFHTMQRWEFESGLDAILAKLAAPERESVDEAALAEFKTTIRECYRTQADNFVRGYVEEVNRRKSSDE